LAVEARALKFEAQVFYIFKPNNVSPSTMTPSRPSGRNRFTATLGRGHICPVSVESYARSV